MSPSLTLLAHLYLLVLAVTLLLCKHASSARTQYESCSLTCRTKITDIRGSEIFKLSMNSILPAMGVGFLLFLGLFTLGYTATYSRQQTHPQREILCYTSSNDLRQLEDSISRCTTLVHKGHDLQDFNTSGLRGIRELLKKVNPAIQFVLSIDDHKKSLKTSAGAIQKAIARISTIFNEVDGVELNLTAGAKELLVHFVQGLKREMMRKSDKGRILLSLPTKNELLAKEFDLKSLAKYVDLFTIPTHYLTNDEDLFRTFHPSRLMGLSDLLNTDNLVDLIHGLGVDKEKLLISLPASGYKFTLKDRNDNAPSAPTIDEKPSIINRKEFCKMIKQGEWIIERDSDLTAPYVFNGSNWIAFEDEISTRIKGKYVLLRDLAGLAIDEIVNDFKTNCGRAISEVVYHSFTDNERKTREAVLNSLEKDIQNPENLYPVNVKPSDFRIIQVVDSSGNVRATRENTQTEFTCLKQGHFVHPKSCNRFYRCVKFNQQVEDYSVFEFNCPEGLSFDERTEVCVWPGSLPKASPCPGSSEIAPTAPRRFRCPGEGYYADPNNCRWFFACMNLGEGDMIPYEFRCPYGLVFDERKLVCEWPWLVPACAGKNYEYNGGYGSLHPGLSTFHGTSHGEENDGSIKYFQENTHHRHDDSYSQHGYNNGASKNYTSTIHSSSMSNGYITTVTESSSISNLSPQDNDDFTSTHTEKNLLQSMSKNVVTISSVDLVSKLNKSMSNELPIQTSNSGGIITSFTRKNGKPGFTVSTTITTTENGLNNVLFDNYQNKKIISGKNAITTGKSMQPGSTIAIGNEHYTNQAYSSTIGIKSKPRMSEIGIPFQYTPVINDGITNYKFTGNSQTSIPNEIPRGVTPTLSSKQSGFRYSPTGELSGQSRKNLYDHQSQQTLSNDYTSVPIPEGANGNQFFTNHASKTPLYKNNPFLPSTAATFFHRSTDENPFFSNDSSWHSLYKGNPFLPSATSATSIGGAEGNEGIIANHASKNDTVYKGNPFLPSTPATSFEKITRNQFFTNYPSTTNRLYHGNPFLPPTSATSSGNRYYTNQAGNTEEAPLLSQSNGNGYKTNEYFDNGGRGTIRYNNGLITHKYTEDDIKKNGKIPFQSLAPSTFINQTFRPIGFTKTGPTKTGITTAQLGGSGTYILGTTKPVPISNQNNVETSIISENISSQQYPSYVKPLFESTTSLYYNNEIRRITTQTPTIYDIHMNNDKPMLTTESAIVNTPSSPVLLTAQNSLLKLTTETPFSDILVENKATITTGPIVANTFSPESFPAQNSRPFSISSTVEQPIESTDRYRNRVSSTSTPISIITDKNNHVLLNGPNRKIPSSATENSWKNDEIYNLDDKNKQFTPIPSSMTFNNKGEETNYGKSTQITDQGYSYENESNTFGQKIFQNKTASNGLNQQFGASTRPKIYNSPSATLTASTGMYSSNHRKTSKNPATSPKDDDHHPYPAQPTLKSINGLVDTIRGTVQPTISSEGGSSYNRGHSKYKPYNNKYDENKNNTTIKITTQAPAVTTYNGAYGDSSSPAQSSGIDKINQLEKRGKIVVKYSDLHPVLLEKLEAECTCKSDPFAGFKNNKPLLIDSSKGTVDLRNYDETDVYVELESDKDYSGETLKSSRKAASLSPSDIQISASFNINRNKSRGAKSLGNFENNQVPKAQYDEQFHSPEMEFLEAECARPGLFRHPKFCNKFYICYWDQWKKKFILNVSNCPVHLTFDSSAGACNWPNEGPACQSGHLLV